MDMVKTFFVWLSFAKLQTICMLYLQIENPEGMKGDSIY
jgi:hypothetical protein